MTTTNTDRETRVLASSASPSTCTDVPGAVDVDVTVTIGDRVIEGEVTLVPAQYDGRLVSYGTAPDQWISGGLLAELYAECERATGATPGNAATSSAWFRSACDALGVAAFEAAS
jgi:hypothetical protein